MVPTVSPSLEHAKLFVAFAHRYSSMAAAGSAEYRRNLKTGHVNSPVDVKLILMSSLPVNPSRGKRFSNSRVAFRFCPARAFRRVISLVPAFILRSRERNARNSLPSFIAISPRCRGIRDAAVIEFFPFPKRVSFATTGIDGSAMRFVERGRGSAPFKFNKSFPTYKLPGQQSS